MRGYNLKLEQIKIEYPRKDIEDIFTLLLNDSFPLEKREKVEKKVVAYLKKIEEEIVFISQCQVVSNPKNVYSSINDSLLKIRNTAMAIYEYTDKYCDHRSLPNDLKKLILNLINPLEEALEDLNITDAVIIKTKRLYAQQSFVSRTSDCREKLIQHLKGLKKILLQPDEPPPPCRISYAWPSERKREEEYWVQSFLSILCEHLKVVGIGAVMDVLNNKPGNSIYGFTKEFSNSNYTILVGTRSLLEKHYALKNHVVKTELSIITERFEQDQIDYGQSRIYPMLISGTIDTAYPPNYRGYSTVRDARETGYLGTLKALVDWIYGSCLKKKIKQKSDFLWNEYFKSVTNLPIDDVSVEQEIAFDYHRSPSQIQKDSRAYAFSSSKGKDLDKQESSKEKEKEKGIEKEIEGVDVNQLKIDQSDESRGSLVNDEPLREIGDSEFNEVPVFGPEIINVSGFNHCCGLFALALGVKIAMREKGVSKSERLDFLEAIDEEALKSTTVHTENIAKQLKEEMYWALLLNEAYKERRFYSFTDYCRAELEGGVLAEDMSSFAEANRAYREELKALWLSVQGAVEKQFEESEAAYREYLETKLTPSLIDEFKGKLSKLVISLSSEVKQFIYSYCEEEADLMGELIQFNRLYRSVWHEFEAGTAEQRNRLDELYTKILTEKSIALLEKERGERFITALLKLSFLQKTSFECNGELEKICDKKEIISTAIFLLVRSHIKKEWDVLYKNYCNYIKENRTMLSADELGCLALRWKVKLRIQFGSKEPYETHQEDNPTLIHVTLCNPSQNHWQVYRVSRKEKIKEINLSSVDEPRAKLNFDELSISSEDRGIPFLNCEEEIAECLFLADKEETKVNQMNHNEESSLIFAAEKGDSLAVAQLLEKGADVNQADENGMTSLMIAAANGHQAVVAQSLEKGADVNQADKNGMTPLYVAAQKEHEAVVAQLLEKGANVNQPDENGVTALYIAAQDGREEVVAQLLEKGANVNQANANGWTPLITAAQSGYQGVVEQLLEKGADVNQESETGWTPLFIAVQNGHGTVVAQLLKEGANVNQTDRWKKTPLIIAVISAREYVVAQLLEKGANVNQADEDGETPLYVAAQNGDQAVVTQLLKKGAKVNQANKDGMTPLMIAVENGNQGVVAQLLEKEADVNQANKDGETPLYIAAENGYEDVVAQLLKKGVNVDQSNANRMTPLMIAVENGNQGVVAQLLEKGADVNQADKNGMTPLYAAASKGHEAVVAQLLKKGAKVNQADEHGWTSLMIAAANRHEGVVARLLDNGAKVNQAEQDGWTPLYIAAESGHQGVVAQLLEKGADANQADEQGWTPLVMAVKKGHQGVVTQLLDNGADINQSDRGEVTPLYIAAQNGHQGVVTQLLKKGANVNQAEKDGATPFYIATMHSHFKVAAMLLKAGAKIKNERKENIALLYPHLREWVRWGEYEACLILSDYRLNQEPGVRIEERVIAYYAQGKLDKAFEYLEMLKKKNRQEDMAFIAYSSGYLKMEQGEFDSAIKDYEAALQEDKDNDRVRYDRMLAELYKTGNPEAVLKRLEELPNPEAFQNKEDVVYSYHVKGFIYHQCLQHEKALGCFNEGLKRDEKDIFALAKRGFLLLCQGKRKEGLKDLDAALAINSYYSGALARKGYGLALEGGFDEAGEYFKRSLEVNPLHFETLLLKGASLILQKRLKRAKECIEKTFAVSISRALLIAQHMPQEAKGKVIDYAFEYSLKDKEKLKEVLLVLLQLNIFCEKTQEKVALYLMKAYSEEELNVLLRAASESSLLYEMLCQIVLNNAKKHQIEKEQREVYFETKQKELYHQLTQLTDENLLAIQKENIQKELEQLFKTQERVDDLRNLLNECFEPTELGIEYSASSLVWQWLTPREGFLVSEIDSIMQSIDYFMDEYSSPSYQSVRESFKIIRAIYNEYQENVRELVNNKELQAEEREQRLNELYVPRCRLSMASFRDRYLKKEVQNCLAPHEGEVEEKRGETVYGTHVVKKCGEVHFKYHHNINPCYPVIEYMVGTLYSLLAKTSYGTAPTEIVKLHHKGYARVLVASQTIEGINLFDFLTHYPGLIQQFDSHSFSTIIITSLLSNPVDGKPDNYMVQFFKDENEEEKIKVLGFDNDLAFGEPIVKIHQGKRAGQHFVEVRNVFYFFPQMNAPIDPTLYKRLVEESPELLMLEFIRSLQKQDEYYKQLLKEGVLTLKETEALQLPICFLREETLGIMYKRLRAVQRCLRENSQLSHTQLFYAIYPEMAKYYEEVASKNQAKPNAILRNIAELYAASASTLEEATLISEQKSIVTMSRVAIKTMEKGEYAKPCYSLLKGIEKFVESIQFSEISVERQRQILREIKSLSGIEQLTIRNCEGLDDKLLQVLIEDLPTLKTLDLIGCSQIKAQSLAMASPRGRVVKIQITQEESKKQESTPQFKEFLVQSGKSEKVVGKEKESLEEPAQKIKFKD